MKKNITFIGILCILTVVIAISGCTNPFTTNNTSKTNLQGIVVNSGQSIQSAIDSAPAGSNIIVNPGTYSQTLSIDKNVTLIANGTVNLGEVGISGTGATIKGFTLTGDYPIHLSNSSSINVMNNTIHSNLNGISDTGTNTNLLISGNTIIGTSSTYGNGMAFEGVTSNSQVKDNSISGTQHGILFDVASTNNTISGNTVTGNNGDQAGIYTILGSTNFQILNNKVSKERDGIAIQPLGSGTASGFKVDGNICTDNHNAIWMTVSDSVISNNVLDGNVEGIDITGTGNIIRSNIITNNSVVGIALTTQKSTDGNTVINNTLSGNGGNYYTGGPGNVIGE